MYYSRTALTQGMFLLCLSFLTAGTALASGFALIENSAKGVGQSFAGGAATADDTSTVFFNPAGMTRFEGTRMDAVANVIIPTIEFSNQGSLVNPAFAPFTGSPTTPLSGGNGGDAGEDAFVPNFYLVHELSKEWRMGIGINAPFGLKTSYEDGWVGRYHALDSELQTININPSIAYKFKEFSVGVGVSALYADATLSNAIDLSGSCIGALGAAAPAVCGPAGLLTPANPATDGAVQLDADDWGFGANIGVLYEPSEHTRFGFHYRSHIDLTLEGKATFSNTQTLAGILGTGALTNQTASADLSLPETFAVSGYHQFDERWAVMADATYTKWDRFKQLVVKFDGGQPTQTTPENWDNSWRLSAGVNYMPTRTWTIRGGLAYDQTPIPNATFRTPRLPGNDRYWASLGASYQASKSLSFDIGYAHLFVDDAQINNTEVNTGHILTGSYESDVNILSLQVGYRF